MGRLAPVLIEIAPALVIALVTAAAKVLDALGEATTDSATLAGWAEPAGVTVAYLAGLGALSLILGWALGRWTWIFRVLALAFVFWLGLSNYCFTPLGGRPFDFSGSSAPAGWLALIAAAALVVAFLRERFVPEEGKAKVYGGAAGMSAGMLAAVGVAAWWNSSVDASPPVLLIGFTLWAIGGVVGRIAYRNRPPSAAASTLAVMTALVLALAGLAPDFITW